MEDSPLEPPQDAAPQGSPPQDTHPPDTPPEPPADGPVFWGYSELFLFVGLFIPALLAGYGLVQTFVRLTRLQPSKAAEGVAQQSVTYLFAFLVLIVIFRVQYGRPFWRSLGWDRLSVAPFLAIGAGCATAIGVNIIGALMRMQDTDTPLMQLMRDPASMALLTVFGVTAAPIAEELAFRGFIQPLLVKSVGVIQGILITSLAFGLLHFSEYGNSWRHVVLITAAGAAFGWMRQVTGSTKASSLMHSAYNALFFAALWASRQHS